MIKVAQIEDLPGIIEIYNQAIDARFQTAFTEHWAAKERTDWFGTHDASYPLLVYMIDGKVAGWLSISPYRSGRAALKTCVEISYFVHNKHKGKGIGKALLAKGLETCRQLGYKTALAIIIEKNMPSIQLAEKFGFEKWGHLPGVVNFGGEVCAHLYYGITL
jgi:phosphinothricin acetyltransferase